MDADEFGKTMDALKAGAMKPVERAVDKVKSAVKKKPSAAPGQQAKVETKQFSGR